MAPRKGFIYVLFVNNMFKVGRSDDFMRRFNEYPKGTELVMVAQVEDMIRAEDELKQECGATAALRLVAGKEYFSGDETEIHRIFNQVKDKHALRHSLRRPAVPAGVPAAIPEEDASDGSSDDETATDAKLQAILHQRGHDPRLWKSERNKACHSIDFYERPDPDTLRWTKVPFLRSYKDLERHFDVDKASA